MATTNINAIELSDYKGGVNYNLDLLALAENESPNSMNIEFNGGDLIRKRFGFREVNSTATGSDTCHSLYDFGVSATDRKLIAHFGSTLYKMDGLDGTMDILKEVVTDTQSYMSEVKQRLIVCYNDGSTELYWDGVNPIASLSPNTPGFTYAVEHQGFLLGARTVTNKLRIYYEDINTMIGGDYDDYFTLTGPLDDEVTGWFKINGRLYAGTKTGIFRVSYIGGVAVFEYKQVVSDVGMVPRTVQSVITKEYGQVAIFLGYDLQMYLFDGSFVRAISEKYREANNDTNVALDYIEQNKITNCASVYDLKEQVYRLFVTSKGNDTNTYCLNINVETLAYYPYDNMAFHDVVIAKDSIGRRFVVGGDYAGKVHKLFGNYNNDNGTAIIEFYEGPPIKQSLERAKTGRTLDLYFVPKARYSLRMEDRADFDKTWKHRTDIPMYDKLDRFLGQNTVLGTTAKLGSEVSVAAPSVNIPVVSNVYRYKLHTNGTAGTICSYETGTVAGTGGTTTITGTGTAWTAAMTAANGYKIWIDSGDHANTTYDFTYASATSATVSTLGAGDISGATYQIFKTGDAACSLGWELTRADYNLAIASYNKASTRR